MTEPLAHLLPPTWLVPPEVMAACFAVSLVASALFSLLVIAGGPIDRPRDRGSHDRPTPTSGGLAIMAATALGTGLTLWYAGHDISGSWKDGILLFGFATLLGLSGAIDDLVGLPARWRLGFQVAMSLLFALCYHVDSLNFGLGLVVPLPAPVGLLGSAAWLILCMNTINFMDGSNGLAAGTQGLALIAIVLLALLMAPVSLLGAYLGIPAVICLCAAGAHVGFTPFNMPGGKVFQGDAGAHFAGALIGGACLQLKAYGVGSMWFGGFLLAPLLVDVVLTLLTRLLKRRDIFKAHKEHLYQLWLQRRDPSHMRLAFRIWALCAFTSVVGLVARLVDHHYGTDIRFPALVVIITGLSIGWFSVRRRLLSPAAEPTS